MLENFEDIINRIKPDCIEYEKQIIPTPGGFNVTLEARLGNRSKDNYIKISGHDKTTFNDGIIWKEGFYRINLEVVGGFEINCLIQILNKLLKGN